MQVFVSHAKKDSEKVHRILSRLREDGHEICNDFDLNPGDNITELIDRGLQNADAFVFVISENSLKSEWVRYEFTTIALKDISQNQKRIIPLRIDDSPVPGYMAGRVYIDLSDDFDAGLERLSKALSAPLLADSIPGAKSLGSARDSHESNVQKLSHALRRGRLTLVCGAGVSVGAGIPGWNSLLGLKQAYSGRFFADLAGADR